MGLQKPGFLQNIWRKAVFNPEYRSNPTVSVNDWEAYSRLYNLDGFTNPSIDQGTKLADVYTCINILSQSIAWIPKSLKRPSKNNGTEVMDQHPYHNLIKIQPNAYMSSYNFWTTIGVHMWGWGEAFALINSPGTINDTNLQILEPWNVTTSLIEGDLFYTYKSNTFPAREVLHFRMYTNNGWKGISPIRQNASLLGFALKQQDYTANVFGNKPTGMLVSKGGKLLGPEQSKKASEAFKSKIDAGEIPVGDGLEYVPIMVPPEEAQFIQTQRLTAQRTYGIYRVPPIFGQDYENANFANSEQQNLVFVQHALMPPVTNIEQELKIKLLSVGRKPFFKIQTNALLRGDLKTRKEFYQTLLTLGVYSPKRVLELEDEPWTNADDVKYIQGAMVPVKNLSDFQSQNGDPIDANSLREKLNKLRTLELLDNGQN